MKRSAAVVLVLSGGLLSGCGKREESPQKPPVSAKDSQVLTNDTYIAGRGYYHAPHFAFFPFPYNYHQPGVGYYRGGQFYSHPDLSPTTPTKPGRHANATTATSASSAQVNRGGFTRIWSGRSGIS